ncbi:PASTA domain-containing protein [Actinocorallia populi]|uniref:PASTA domain-containing protein n=1 Tax=Actinocorallia populi TaxID=2079200 RepID=UPI000D096724|nr:PASTA domain-containing protein [Actinocorallia populi]
MPAEIEPDSPAPEPAVPRPADAPEDAEALEGVAAPEPATPMSLRSMVLLGGVMSLGVALILGLTLLVGGAPDRGATGRADAAGTVPSVAGRSLPEATAALAERRLAIDSVVRIPSSLPRGEVVRTTPGAGSPAAEGMPVTVYVSGGAGDERPHDRVTVPYLLGVDGRRAQQVARQLGLRLELPGGNGRVVTQRPDPGTEVASGSPVTVTLG